MIADLHACGKRTLRARMKRLQLERSLITGRMRVTEERTLLMIKPDGVRRGLVGRIITRIEDKGLQISRIRLFQMDDALAQDFYAEHCGKAYFPRLCRFMTSGPVVALEVQSPGAVLLVRAMIGATQPEDRLPGSIRGDFATDVTENIVHASSSLSDAERELRLVFGEGKSSGRD